MWDGQAYTGCDAAIICRDLFDAAQTVFTSRPRTRYPRQQHAFMGPLTCARCGCAITAERKKGKYVYYHCTDSHGAARRPTSAKSASANSAAT